MMGRDSGAGQPQLPVAPTSTVSGKCNCNAYSYVLLQLFRPRGAAENAAMATHPGECSLILTAGQSLRLRGESRWTVTCRAGVVWITQEGDLHDMFLRPGDSFTLDRDGLALVCAVEAAAGAVVGLSEKGAPRATWPWLEPEWR